MYKRILIIGDSGRGKTTLAETLSKKFGIPAYDTDNYFWKVKYTEPANREQSIIDINKIYDLPEWIMSGSTRHLTQRGLEKADIIFNLKFRNILLQYYSVIKRAILRDEERIVDVWNLLVHLTKKKYKKGYGTHMPSLEELVNVYNKKVISFHSYKEINKYTDSL